MSVWWQVLGWVGSAILVVSLLQARVLRLRQLNLLASLLLLAFNVAVGVWPMVAMNAVIAVINIWYLVALVRTRHDPTTYRAIEIGADEPYLRHLLDGHADDIARFNPHLHWDANADDAIAVLVLRDTETVGIVLARDVGGATAEIDLDYVVPRFRDFTPGEFVYRRSGLFTARGLRTLIAPKHMRDSDDYLASVGFRPDGDRRVLTLTE